MKKEKNKTDKPEVSKSSGKRAKIKVEEDPILILSKDKKDKTFDETIEEERKSLFKLYKRTSKYSTIIMIVVVAIFISAFIMYPQPGWGQPVCWTLIGVTLAGMIAYFFTTKNMYPNASKKYFKLFWKESNDFLFNTSEFNDCKIDLKEKYVLPEVVGDRAYTNVVDSASRNIVRGTYKNKGFSFGELAYYSAGTKKGSKKVIFLGRRLEVENSLHFEGRYIINVKGDNETDLPNDIEDLKVLHSQNKFIVYGPENGKMDKDLTKNLIEDIKSIECVGCLLNVNVVLTAGHTVAYISLDDSVAAIPFDKPIDTEAFKNLKKIIGNIFDILIGK